MSRSQKGNHRLDHVAAGKIVCKVSHYKITQFTVDIKWFYVKCSIDVIEPYEYWEERFYIALEKVFYSALDGIEELIAEKKYQVTLKGFTRRASECGMQLEFHIDD